jgi:CheY-like chemotaxis protein/anti-sigma regulatory factor (Ser/Thr protein kinase)
MPAILVVDDSELERRLITSILHQDSEMQTAEAADSYEALQHIRTTPPDLMVTDLVMPGMDGLALMEMVRKELPALPVILVTAHGSEDVVVETLRKGAASYVAKKNLARDLLKTVKEVLEIARTGQQQQRAWACLVHMETHYALNNHPALIQPVTAQLQKDFIRMQLGDENDAVHLSIALYEALANAIYHGNLELSSDLFQRDENAFWQLASIRPCHPPYCDRRVHVTARLSHAEAVYIIRDEGPGFNPARIADPTDTENLEKLSGRGLLLIRTFMSEVFHNDRGNEITMIFRKR